MLRKYQPCIPTRGTKVPHHPDWLHEIKHDGYRLIVQREGERVRMFTRNGHDWSDRYPLIVEAARNLRTPAFVIDGEAVWLGADGMSDFNKLHSHKHDARSAWWRSICFRLETTTSVPRHCTSERPGWRRCWRGRGMAFNAASIWNALSARACSSTPAR
jgi:bifunctional non-homologous end joining protein LigD